MLDVQRKAPRFNCEFEILSNNIKGIGLNLSLKGFGFLTTTEIIAADEIPFVITIVINGISSYTLEGIGNILFSNKKDDNGFYGGFEFLELTGQSKENLLTILSDTINNQGELPQKNSKVSMNKSNKNLDYFSSSAYSHTIDIHGLFHQPYNPDNKDFGKKGLLCSTPDFTQSEMLNFASNDFLGLSLNKEVISAGIQCAEKFGGGNRTSIANSGILSVINDAEVAIAEYCNMEAALLTVSGHVSASGTVSALVRPGDVLIINESCSAGVSEGVILSRAKCFYYENFNLNSFKRMIKRVEGKYANTVIAINTMDNNSGVIGDLTQFLDITENTNYITIIEESYTFGLYTMHAPHSIHIATGSLNETFGINCGFTASSKSMIEYIRNFSKIFFYSNGISSYDAATIIKSIELLKKNNDLKGRLQYNIDLFVKGLEKAGIIPLYNASPIISVMINDELAIREISNKLYENGLYHIVLMYPHVPMGGSLLRFSINATHSENDICKAVSIVEKCFAGKLT
ncbi:MAG: hypothetical protein A2015_00845 [Spirochaetes bacterium GWF1_31_7]|nr:MAG: hypothetical protein A2Y30_12710 [Spirochaetes bacterium GWE1_32_154]OHD51668.1 MAG: hypothetical protein A2Y29_04510 [Spirochaetes bacterium GWE2_31_10]OHD51921.1 MAG: hypothetical protein A2015_00845 [Spirochaetes bacterium GWF1_31_7]OHD75751.1 MAG: hypothetical protein A2355_10720 [Spirochaetes bacterium RIFOXYB1_FULL_32_8]HBD93800.1 hypothetical protein [Spirochaetia bacterium]